MKSDRWNRRQVLKGAGVALCLPWLETFAPATARAQAAGAKRRYISVYQPNGTAQYWVPSGSGTGAGWTLSPLLEPLAEHKSRLIVFQSIANSAPFDGVTYVPNSHAADSASTWTAVKPNGPMSANSGISIDQVIANLIAASGTKTYLDSLQIGLSTVDSFGDGLPNQHSRSMSWKSPSEPLYKTVNPQAVFDRLVAGRPAPNPSPMAGAMAPQPDPAAERRRALNKSTLDFILAESKALQPRLAVSDRARVDQFLTSVRSIEGQVLKVSSTLPSTTMCPAPPTRAANPVSVGPQAGDYNRGTHADVMIDLIAMAIQCDITRVVSFMLDDARSEFVYSFLNERLFTTTGSTPNPANRPVGSYHGLQHAGERNNNTTPGFATIGWWNSSKVAQLASKLAAASEGSAGSVLDNTVITFASGMHGGDHMNNNLPVALVGGSNLLKGDLFVTGAERQLSDVHFTILQAGFGYKEPSFGVGRTVLTDILV